MIDFAEERGYRGVKAEIIDRGQLVEAPVNLLTLNYEGALPYLHGSEFEIHRRILLLTNMQAVPFASQAPVHLTTNYHC